MHLNWASTWAFTLLVEQEAPCMNLDHRSKLRLHEKKYNIWRNTVSAINGETHNQLMTWVNVTKCYGARIIRCKASIFSSYSIFSINPPLDLATFATNQKSHRPVVLIICCFVTLLLPLSFVFAALINHQRFMPNHIPTGSCPTSHVIVAYRWKCWRKLAMKNGC